MYKYFPDEQLFVVQSNHWYVDIVNCLVTSTILKIWNKYGRDRILQLVKFYI